MGELTTIPSQGVGRCWAGNNPLTGANSHSRSDLDCAKTNRQNWEVEGHKYRSILRALVPVQDRPYRSAVEGMTVKAEVERTCPRSMVEEEDTCLRGTRVEAESSTSAVGAVAGGAVAVGGGSDFGDAEAEGVDSSASALDLGQEASETSLAKEESSGYVIEEIARNDKMKGQRPVSVISLGN
jgi:hypothetical protein